MKRRYRVTHSTVYRYLQPVTFGDHRVLLRPRADVGVGVLHSEVLVGPHPKGVSWTEDAYGNPIGIVSFSKESRSLILSFDSVLDVVRGGPSEIPEDLQLSDLSVRGKSLPLYTRPKKGGRKILQWSDQFVRPTVLETVRGMVQWLESEMIYEPRFEEGTQKPVETLKRGVGACRDFATLFVEAARSMGIPARFTAGYLYDPTRDYHPAPSGGASHAWAQIYLPGIGWYDIDPTSGSMGSDALVPISSGPDSFALSPVSGTWVGFRNAALDFRVDVVVHSVPLEDDVQSVA